MKQIKNFKKTCRSTSVFKTFASPLHNHVVRCQLKLEHERADGQCAARHSGSA
jgi:hypothetical protein